MRGTSHLVIGTSAGLLVATSLARPAWPTVAIAAAAALLPDLDVPSSTASGLFRGATGLAGLAVGVATTTVACQDTHDVGASVVLGVATWAAIQVLVRWLAPWRLLEHRGPFHSLLVAGLAGLVAGSVSGRADVAIAVLMGWLSHLVADDPTYLGQPLLWPLSRRLLHVTPRALRFRSGSWVEWPLALACVLVSVQLARP